MEEDDIVVPPVVDTPEQVTQDEPEYEQQEDGTIVYADGYKITADGKHFGVDGAEVPETVEPIEPVVPAPVAVAKPEPAPVPVQQNAQGQRVYNYQNAYTPQEIEQLRTLEITDPAQAATFRYQRCKQVDNYAADQFDKDLDAFASAAPETVSKYGRQIERARRSLTPEQMQQPGIARQIVGRIALDDIANDPARLEALVTGRAIEPARAVPEPRKPAERAVIPAASRMPTPKPARRVVPTRGPAQGGRSEVAYIKSIRPGLDDDEAREFLEGIRQYEQNKEARR